MGHACIQHAWGGPRALQLGEQGAGVPWRRTHISGPTSPTHPTQTRPNTPQPTPPQHTPPHPNPPQPTRQIDRIRGLAQCAADLALKHDPTASRLLSQRMADELMNMSLEEAMPLTRALGHYLNLTGIAELHHRWVGWEGGQWVGQLAGGD